MTPAIGKIILTAASALLSAQAHALDLAMTDSVGEGWLPFVQAAMPPATIVHDGLCVFDSDKTTADLVNAGNSKRGRGAVGGVVRHLGRTRRIYGKAYKPWIYGESYMSRQTVHAVACLAAHIAWTHAGEQAQAWEYGHGFSVDIPKCAEDALALQKLGRRSRKLHATGHGDNRAATEAQRIVEAGERILEPYGLTGTHHEAGFFILGLPSNDPSGVPGFVI